MALLQHIRKRLATRLLKSKAGFSLTELLVTIVIITLVSMVVLTGIPAAHQSYVSVTDSSNAQVLLSTTSTRLRDVLSAANPESVEGGTGGTLVSFTSYETGFRTEISNNDTQGLSIKETNVAGYSPSDTAAPLVPVAAARGLQGNMHTAAESIEYANGVFTVKNLRVYRGDEPVENARVETMIVRVLAS